MLWTCIERIYCPYKCSYNYCSYLSDILQCHLFLIFVRHSTVSPVPHIRQTFYSVTCSSYSSDILQCHLFLILVRHSTVWQISTIIVATFVRAIYPFYASSQHRRNISTLATLHRILKGDYCIRELDIVTFCLYGLPMQSVPITTKVVSSNPAQARCTQYNIMW
jgi:hypothetical protein